MGRISLPMDVRSSNDIPAFEQMLSRGPMAIVLVYADWCGHCTKYKENVWSPLKSTKGRKLNMASVHYDQLENTSLNNSKIEGYPSLLVVGTDKKPAVFNNDSGTTNAMPNANDLNTMKKLVTAPVKSMNLTNRNKTINNAVNNSFTNMNMTNSSTNNSAMNNSAMNNSAMNNSSMNNSAMNNSSMNNSVMNKTAMNNDYTNLTASTPSVTMQNTPPNISGDSINTLSSPNNAAMNSLNEENKPLRNNTQGTTPLLRGGGRLYRKLSTKKQRKYKKRSVKRKN